MFLEWKYANSLQYVLRELDCHDYLIMAGGTDLMVAKRAGALADCDVLDLHKLHRELGTITVEKTGGAQRLKIGAMATHEEIVGNELVARYAPALAKAAESVGSPQIRIQGTIGGNICNASPAADTMPALVALNAQVCLESISGKRIMPLSEFVIGPGKTCRRKNELLSCIYVPADTEGYSWKFIKIGKRNSMAISIISCVWMYSDWELRISFGSVSSRPKRAKNLEQLWSKRKVAGRKEIKKALGSDISPISDGRASAAYRFAMAEEIAYDLFKKVED